MLEVIAGLALLRLKVILVDAMSPFPTRVIAFLIIILFDEMLRRFDCVWCNIYFFVFMMKCDEKPKQDDDRVRVRGFF